MTGLAFDLHQTGVDQVFFFGENIGKKQTSSKRIIPYEA